MAGPAPAGDPQPAGCPRLLLRLPRPGGCRLAPDRAAAALLAAGGAVQRGPALARPGAGGGLRFARRRLGRVWRPRPPLPPCGHGQTRPVAVPPPAPPAP